MSTNAYIVIVKMTNVSKHKPDLFFHNTLIRGLEQMKTVRIIVAVLAAAAFSASAYAQIANNGLYLGGGGGGVKYNGFNQLCRDITGALPGFDVDAKCDSEETAAAWKLFGGYRWNQYVAIEAGYISLGEVSGNTEIFGQDVNGKISGHAIFGELIGSIPLGQRARAFGKLGISTLTAELSTDVFAVPLAGSAFGTTSSFSKDFTETMFGLGLEFGFSDKVMGRLEWERIDFEDGIDMYTANIVFYPGK